jgi:dTDP-glucose 4,6-dehydratase
LKIIAGKLSIEFEDLINEAPDRAGKDFAYKLLSNKIRDELGWADTIPLETGIDQTITWIKDNIELLEKLPMEYKHKR